MTTNVFSLFYRGVIGDLASFDSTPSPSLCLFVLSFPSCSSRLLTIFSSAIELGALSP